MPRTAYRKTAAVHTVYTLIRTDHGHDATCGQFSSKDKAQAGAEAVIRQACGIKPRTVLRLPWVDDQLCYGRDAHDFRFRIEVWPMDSEDA